LVPIELPIPISFPLSLPLASPFPLPLEIPFAILGAAISVEFPIPVIPLPFALPLPFPAIAVSLPTSLAISAGHAHPGILLIDKLLAIYCSSHRAHHHALEIGGERARRRIDWFYLVQSWEFKFEKDKF